MSFLAKPLKEGVTLSQHIKEVVKNSEDLFQYYPHAFSKDDQFLIKLACEVHDYGKLDTHFQEKMKTGRKRLRTEVHHSQLGVLFIDVPRLEEEGYSMTQIKAVVTAIYHHHIRKYQLFSLTLKQYAEQYLLPNVLKFETEPTLGVIPKGEELGYDNLDYVLFELEGGGVVDLLEWLEYVKIKGILNKCDYNASNKHQLPIEIPHPSEKEKQLPTLIQKKMELFDSSQSFDDLLYDSQKFLRDHQGENVVLIAPAGSGKTEGALLWAGNQKTFYTLPLKVSSTAIYRRIKRDYEFEEVALLHSDALNLHLKEQENEDARALRRYESMRDLAYPITVCTVDQLFKFVFKTVGTELTAATLKYSCVIIDEIQMYSPKIMAFLCYGLKLVHLLGGKFLMMTATIPPMVVEYLEKNKIPFTPGKYSDTKATNRHCVKVIQGEFNYNQILKEGQEKKVLILCNTIKQAQAVYLELKEQCCSKKMSLRLLHSNFTKKHRQQLEQEILAFAGKDSAPGNGIWISTQIVEASLDIDFDVLHTEMCPADSLFQRMGRCYRSRTYTGDTANVFIYNTENSYKHFYSELIYDRTLEALLPYQDCYLSEEEKMKMIDRIFNSKCLEGDAYYKEFWKAIEELELIQPGEFEKREGDYLFREINSLTVIPDEIYNPHQDELERLAVACSDKNLSLEERLKLYDEFMSYCLNISLYKEERKSTVDTISTFQLSKLKIYRCRSKYDFEEDDEGHIIGGRGLVLKELNEDCFV